MANSCQLLPARSDKWKLTRVRNLSNLVRTEKVPIVSLDMMEPDSLFSYLPALVGAMLDELRH